MKQPLNISTITPKVSNSYEVGAILYDSWGYEQTNYDFYCIVKVSGDFVTIAPMTKSSVSIGGWDMASKVSPIAIKDGADCIRKKVKTNLDGEKVGFSLRGYTGGGWCSLWDGKVKTATHYA